ncbi:MAG: hypothetical protein FIA95_03210, partial [Gemmatimonadetes bacterium]|nr:hypothetical protein [Gemmatimonadota bacterium]
MLPVPRVIAAPRPPGVRQPLPWRACVLTLKAFGALDFRDEACESIPALLAQPKRAALLAYLILAHPGGLCRRDTLLALFWPDLDEEAGRHALSQALSFLRRHLPEGVLLTRGAEEVGIDAARVRSDVQAFQRALAAEEWGDAVAHYHGELLDGLHVAAAAPFTDWVDRERERLREAAAAAAWQEAHGLIAGGYLVEAGRAGQVAHRLVPTDESAVRTFIEALATGGDRAAALRFYEKFAGILAQELEVEPARETRAVAERIRSGEVVVTLRTPPPGVVTPLPFPPVAEARGAKVVAAEEGVDAGGAAPAAAMPARKPWTKSLAIGGAFVTVVVAAAFAYVALRPDPLDLTVTDIRPVSSDPGVEYLPAISPDGKNVAFVRSGRIVVRSVDHVPGQGEVIGADPAGGEARFPTWTSDGESIRFMICSGLRTCAWKETHRTGGTLRTPELPAGTPADREGRVAWSEDGAKLAFFRGDTLFVAEDGGEARAVFSMDPARRRFGELHSLAWSPDGTRIAFVNGRNRAAGPVDMDPSAIWIADISRGTATEAAGGEASNLSPVWRDHGAILFASTRDGPRALYLLEVGPNGARGEPRLVPGAPDPHTLSYSRASGRLAFARFTAERNIRSYPLDPPAPVPLSGGEPVTTGSQLIGFHDVSRDGKWIVYDSDLLGTMDLYRMALPSGEVVRLTGSPGDELGGRWSPDGREIAFSGATRTPEPGQYEVFVMDADGGTPVQVTHTTDPRYFNSWPTWSFDGLTLAYTTFERGDWKGGGLVRRDSVGGSWTQLDVALPAGFHYGGWAADGRSLVFNPWGYGDVLQ